MSKDLLKTVAKGDPLEAQQHNLIVRMVGQACLGQGAFIDGTGVYFRPQRPKKPVETVPFVLTEDLTTGGSAKARKLEWNASYGEYRQTDEEITVVDTRSSWADAPAGTGGEARVRQGPEGEIYEIIDLFCNKSY